MALEQAIQLHDRTRCTQSYAYPSWLCLVCVQLNIVQLHCVSIIQPIVVIKRLPFRVLYFLYTFILLPFLSVDLHIGFFHFRHFENYIIHYYNAEVNENILFRYDLNLLGYLLFHNENKPQHLRLPLGKEDTVGIHTQSMLLTASWMDYDGSLEGRMD